jgi:hypothetical protein
LLLNLSKSPLNFKPNSLILNSKKEKSSLEFIKMGKRINFILIREQVPMNINQQRSMGKIEITQPK